MTNSRKTCSLLWVVSHNAVRIAKSLFAIATVSLAMLIPLAVFYSNEGLRLVQQHFAEPASYYPTGSISALLVIISFIAALSWRFLFRLEQVAASARMANPFVKENAARLLAMAWLMVAIVIAHFPAATLGLAVETAFKGPSSEVQLSFDTIALLATISLFMLAGVFQQGTNPRHVEGEI